MEVGFFDILWISDVGSLREGMSKYLLVVGNGGKWSKISTYVYVRLAMLFDSCSFKYPLRLAAFSVFILATTCCIQLFLLLLQWLVELDLLDGSGNIVTPTFYIPHVS